MRLSQRSGFFSLIAVTIAAAVISIHFFLLSYSNVVAGIYDDRDIANKIITVTSAVRSAMFQQIAGTTKTLVYSKRSAGQYQWNSVLAAEDDINREVSSALEKFEKGVEWLYNENTREALVIMDRLSTSFADVSSIPQSASAKMTVRVGLMGGAITQPPTAIYVMPHNEQTAKLLGGHLTDKRIDEVIQAAGYLGIWVNGEVAVGTIGNSYNMGSIPCSVRVEI